MSDNHERFLQFCRAGDSKNVQLLLSADPTLLEIKSSDFVSLSQNPHGEFLTQAISRTRIALRSFAGFQFTITLII